jgi:hypothetical protein
MFDNKLFATIVVRLKNGLLVTVYFFKPSKSSEYCILAFVLEIVNKLLEKNKIERN